MRRILNDQGNFQLFHVDNNIFHVKKKKLFWSSPGGSEVMNLTSIHKDVCLIPGLAQWVKDLMLP